MKLSAFNIVICYCLQVRDEIRMGGDKEYLPIFDVENI